MKFLRLPFIALALLFAVTAFSQQATIMVNTTNANTTINKNISASKLIEMLGKTTLKVFYFLEKPLFY